MKSLSHVRLLVTPWTAAFQAPPSMGFSRQEYWSGVPLPSPHERVQIAKGLKNLWVSLPGISVVGVTVLGQEDGISAPGGWPLLVPPPGWMVDNADRIPLLLAHCLKEIRFGYLTLAPCLSPRQIPENCISNEPKFHEFTHYTLQKIWAR